MLRKRIILNLMHLRRESVAGFKDNQIINHTAHHDSTNPSAARHPAYFNSSSIPEYLAVLLLLNFRVSFSKERDGGDDPLGSQ